MLQIPSGTFGRIARSPRLNLVAIIFLLTSVILALVVALYAISAGANRDDESQRTITTLQKRLDCRSASAISFDLAAGQGYVGILKGLRLTIDADQDGVPTRPEYADTLTDINVSISIIETALTARGADLQDLQVSGSC